MATIGDGFKDVFLAGIGAMAITGEKTKELVDQLISKGEITVDQGKELVDQLISKGEITVEQGKQINSELKHKAEEVATSSRYDVLEARMKVMSPEERSAFAAKTAEIASKMDAREPEKKAESPAAAEVESDPVASGTQSQDSGA